MNTHILFATNYNDNKILHGPETIKKIGSVNEVLLEAVKEVYKFYGTIENLETSISERNIKYRITVFNIRTKELFELTDGSFLTKTKKLLNGKTYLDRLEYLTNYFKASLKHGKTEDKIKYAEVITKTTNILIEIEKLKLEQ